MARLTAAQRKALPASAFAGPHRSFPIPDKKHALAAQMLAGKAPASAQNRIEEMAEKKLGTDSKAEDRREKKKPNLARQLAGK